MPNNVKLYESEKSKYRGNESTILQVAECKRSVRDDKFYERVKIDRNEYGMSNNDKDNIALIIRNYTRENDWLLQMINCK